EGEGGRVGLRGGGWGERGSRGRVGLRGGGRRRGEEGVERGRVGLRGGGWGARREVGGRRVEEREREVGEQPGEGGVERGRVGMRGGARVGLSGDEGGGRKGGVERGWRGLGLGVEWRRRWG
ncbi:hypothetical protein KP509_12G086300, partial [Ceratopteris richardii]